MGGHFIFKYSEKLNKSVLLNIKEDYFNKITYKYLSI